MSEQLTVVEFLRARLDERTALAVAAGGGSWRMRDHESDPWVIVDETGEFVVHDEGSPSDEQAAHIAANDPARVLREVAAQRAILDGYIDGWFGLDQAVQALAAIHVDHPDYRAGWTP